jgi:hypothetical protein
MNNECGAELACRPASKNMFCHQCAGHARVAVAWPGRQWYAGPGSAVDRKLRMRSVWQAAWSCMKDMMSAAFACRSVVAYCC